MKIKKNIKSLRFNKKLNIKKHNRLNKLFFLAAIGVFLVANVKGQAVNSKIRNISSFEFVADMGVGWNLGNTFDAKGEDETAWGNPKTTKAMIDEVAQKGFKTLRLPVTWQFHMGDAPEYKLEQAWLDRVEEVANYAFDNRMYVVLNIHHDDEWIIPSLEKVDSVQNQLKIVWTQIANHFKDYGDYLILETLNEPRLVGSPDEWIGGAPEGRTCVNKMQQTCVDAIRTTGGNNALRHIMVSAYAASSIPKVINDFVIPNDERIIVSVHNYGPYSFCLANKTQSWGSNEDKTALDEDLDNVYNFFNANGHPVVIGEWGSLHQKNIDSRIKHAKHFANACIKRGICPILWDNGNLNEFGVFNREELSWHYPELVDEIVNAPINSTRFNNPIIRHLRTADPSPHIWEDGKVWLYASHDPNWAQDYSTMDGYHVFSSYDLVNWTDHGEVLHSRDVAWGIEAGGFMFAPDAAYKNGTYYLYYPHMQEGWKWRIGVATSKKPEGPFTDVGFVDGTDNIDPTCFIDDDGQAYLMWCGDHKPPKIAKLKENMVELAEEPRIIEYGADNCGEGPYMHKYKGKYYFSYTCHSCSPYMGYYAMGDSPYGPFEYKGELNLCPDGAQDHHSMIEYHNQWYYFYHKGNYGTKGSGYRRNTCIDSMFYNEDGTIQEIIQTRQGIAADPIGLAKGQIVPGEFSAENFFLNGKEIVNTNENTSVIINHNSKLLYVLNVLGSETYNIEIETSKTERSSTVYFYIDEKLRDSVFIEKKSKQIKTALFIPKGKHTLKLRFSKPKTKEIIVSLESIKIQGDKEYFTVNASAIGSGNISPKGLSYVEKGDSLNYRFSWNNAYKPGSLEINGKSHPTQNSYTLQNITENQNMVVNFDPCEGTPLLPNITINNSSTFSISDTNLLEGNNFKLSVDHKGSGTFWWIDPFKEYSKEKEVVRKKITPVYSGIYTAHFIDKNLCKSEVDFNIVVDPIILEVYEAEDFKDQSGIQSEGCNDIGGGRNIGFIENGDWMNYEVEVKETGNYKFTTRVATGSKGGTIELSNNNEVFTTIPVNQHLSGGWQSWYTTKAVEVHLEKGMHNIKMTFKGDEGYLFNINWFDIE